MTQAMSPSPVANNPPNVITLRDLLAQREQSGERFRLSEVVAIVVPICTDIAQRQARGETVYVHASAIGAGLDGVPRLIAELAKHKPTDPKDVPALAPELAKAAPNARSSVFGIGAVVYEMLTLHPIGPGMKPPSAVVAGIPPIVDTILAKALVTDPAQRPDDLPAFAQAIHHFAPASVAPPPNVDETAFEVDLDLRSSMLPPGGLNLANPTIPKAQPVRVQHDDPFAAVLGPPASRRTSPSQHPPPINRTSEELNALKARLEADPAPRWIVVKDKMDHGPFAAIELLQQIASDTFRPDDILVDTHNNSRTKIKEHAEFSRFAHHANLRREEVSEKKAVVALEKSEGRAGAAKGVIGVIAVVAVIGIAGFVVWKIKGKADEDERKRKEQDGLSIAGEGSIDPKTGKPKAKWGGGGGGGGGYAGGSNADEALKKSVSDFEAESLMPNECSAPVGGGIAAACGLNGSARAKTVVQNGKAIGVTVTTDPNQPGVNSCMEGRIRGLSWRSVAGVTVCIRTFKAN
jgi:hypothetical protein